MSSQINLDILSDLVVFTKYAKHIKELGRRETFREICKRNEKMHLKQFTQFPELCKEIKTIYRNFVLKKKVLPSMRSLQFSGKPIELSPNRIFNCFSEETKFITSLGTKSFKDFNDGDSIYVPTHTGEIKPAIVKSYGKQQLYEHIFVRGRSKKSIWATENHRWILKDKTETTSIKEGDCLVATPERFSKFNYEKANPLERLYWCYGYTFGDGTRVKNENKEYTYSMVRLCGDDVKYEPRFTEMGFKSSSPMSINGDIMCYTGKYLKTAPNPKIDDEGLIRAFVHGYLSADGHKNPDWYDNNELSQYKAIQTSEKDHWEFIEECFEIAGIYILNKTDLTGQETNFGIRPETYRYSLSSNIGRNNKHTWSLKEIKSEYRIDSNYRNEIVWCLEVQDDHSFILSSGIPTGNCAYLPIDDIAAFSEIMFLLLGGTGIGYSVQSHHVEKLPPIQKPTKTRRYLIGDSIEGWADSIKALMRAYMNGKSLPRFDFSDIRTKGAALVTSGGKAPGPQPLKDCLHHIQGILDSKENGEQLTTLEVHDIVCYIADAVLAGGIRRAALISLFSLTDTDMLTCKFGDWFELNSQRGRANNSAVIVRHRITKRDFLNLWKKIKMSGNGEPGFYFTNNKELGTNPCCEISLKAFQFCNLCEINLNDVDNQEEFEVRVKAATFLGTLQAAYTDFHYLRDIWKKTTEKDALIGISCTGIASGAYKKLDLTKGAEIVKKENKRIADIIGIAAAARTTCVKPAGTSSLVLGSSSGIHAWHSSFFIRRMRLGKNEAIYEYLKKNHKDLVEDEFFKPDQQAVVSIPIAAPKGAITRSESAIDLLERVKVFSEQWVKPGHIKGDNTHNVSATISIKDDEWDEVAQWMWNNKEAYNGLSILPFSGGNYVQAPFEEISVQKFTALNNKLKKIDLTRVKEDKDNTNLKGEVACSGSKGCDI